MLHRNLALFGITTVFYLTAASTPVTQAQQAAAPASSERHAGTGSKSGASAEGGQSPALQHRNVRYRLHPGDVLDLNFSFTPEFNQVVTIQPDGYITLRGADSVRVGGQTIPELTNTVHAAYAAILHDPAISVELRDFEKPYFIVGGEVSHPGKFDLRGETTVAQAVAIAGDLKETAKHSRVLIFHRVPEGWVQTRNLNLKRMLRNGDLQEDIYLQPGDFVYVPKNTWSKIQRFIPTPSMGYYLNPGR